MSRKRSLLPGVLGGVVGAGAITGYIYYLRPKMVNWGATGEEIGILLAGDELEPAPKICSTFAITIETPPYRVWPWLVQIGQGRGGFYTYDWLENLMGLKIHSADRLLAMYQDLKVGDNIPLSPNGIALKVVHIVENQALVLFGDTREAGDGVEQLAMRPGDYLTTSWGFYLFETPRGHTRLVERWLANWNPSFFNNLIYRAVVEPGSFIMRTGMLRGIKDRAEGRTVWETAGSDTPISADHTAGLETGQLAANKDLPLAQTEASGRGPDDGEPHE